MNLGDLGNLFLSVGLFIGSFVALYMLFNLDDA